MGGVPELDVAAAVTCDHGAVRQHRQRPHVLPRLRLVACAGQGDQRSAARRLVLRSLAEHCQRRRALCRQICAWCLSNLDSGVWKQPVPDRPRSMPVWMRRISLRELTFQACREPSEVPVSTTFPLGFQATDSRRLPSDGRLAAYTRPGCPSSALNSLRQPSSQATATMEDGPGRNRHNILLVTFNTSVTCDIRYQDNQKMHCQWAGDSTRTAVSVAPASSGGCIAMSHTAPPIESVRCLGLLPWMSHSVSHPSRPAVNRRHAPVLSSRVHAMLVIARSREPASL